MPKDLAFKCSSKQDLALYLSGPGVVGIGGCLLSLRLNLYIGPADIGLDVLYLAGPGVFRAAFHSTTLYPFPIAFPSFFFF